MSRAGTKDNNKPNTAKSSYKKASVLGRKSNWSIPHRNVAVHNKKHFESSALELDRKHSVGK